MWLLAPKTGYLSVVLARLAPDDPRPDPDHLNVRARRREHLEMLQALSPELAKMTIQESGPDKDYGFRLVPVAKSAFAQLMFELVMEIGYTNHKAACASEPLLGEDFQHALHAIWSATRTLQRPLDA